MPISDPFSPPTPTESLNLLSRKEVPNLYPTQPSPIRLAIVGEAPGADEESYGTPFIGASGDLLTRLLASVGILRAGCFIGNICRYRPPNNKLELWGANHELVQQGRREILAQLTSWKPNCVLALGNWAMWGILGEPYGVLENWKISDYAGSIEWSKDLQCKVIPAFHPAFILREYKLWYILKEHLRLVAEEARTPLCTLPQRRFDLDLSCEEICYRLDHWPAGVQASVDIEGGLTGWKCISVADSPDHAFIIAFSKFNEADQGRIYTSLSRFLYRLDVPKVLQNGLYDNFVLYYGFNMLVRNHAEDTLIKAAELHPELPKSLDVQAHLWTREPQWKNLIAYSAKEQKRRAKLGTYDPITEQRNMHRACCIDSAVTLEISRGQDGVLSGGNLRHYREQLALNRPFLYMEKRGILYDTTRAQEELAKCRTDLSEVHTRLEVRAGFSLLGKTSISDDKVKDLLYSRKGYPVQYNGRGPDKKIASDVGALLKLSTKFPQDPLIGDLLLASKLDGVRKTLEWSWDPDCRMRSAYSQVGTETMRTTSKKSPTGSGNNLQTVMKKLRKLYIADPGMWLFQCDLAGADGWTVAAHCLKHGDPTMWDDYMYGLKPAKIIALMYTYGPEINRLPRAELKALCDKESLPGGVCDQDSWLYFACKRVQHATNYGTKAPTGCQQILEDSYKVSGTPVVITEVQFNALQRYYFYRYSGLYQWHEWAKTQVASGENLTGASGHTREFLGRRRSWDYKTKTLNYDQDTWREFLADEPQENTTYACNSAMLRLWVDPENRYLGPGLVRPDRTTTRLRVEPLHQVHDAIVGQFRQTDTEWACPKITSWFQNILTIANTKVVIPFEGAYGPSWGNLGHNCWNGHKLKKGETVCSKCGAAATGGGYIG